MQTENQKAINKQTWDLVVKYIPLIRFVANKKGLDEDAIYHCGIDVLLRCVRNFKSGKTKLSTYMTAALFRSLNGRETVRRVFPGYVQCVSFSEETEQETKDFVSLVRTQLDEYEWNLLYLHFFHYLTYEEIGDIVCLSKTQVYRHMQVALKNARKVLSNGDDE